MKKLLILVVLVVVLAFSSLSITANADSSASVEITSREGVLMSENGDVLVSHNALDKRPIASMTKIMTLLCVYDAIDNGKLKLDDDVLVSSAASGMGGSQVFLDSNSTHKASQLIKSIIVCSANDSCVALAEHICGSEGAFVDCMNRKSAEIGLKNTKFANCTGLPAPDQFSCAIDVGHMLIKLAEYGHYKQCANIWMEDYVHPDGRIIGMTNTNKLVKFYNGCDGGKTGFTNEAMFCLATTAMRGETRLYAVIIGGNSSETRFGEASKLLNYGFANYESKCLLDSSTLIENVAVKRGKADDVEVVANGKLVAFGNKGNVDACVEFEFDDLVAPIAKGDVVGKANLVINGKVTDSVEILAKNDVETKKFIDYLTEIVCR